MKLIPTEAPLPAATRLLENTLDLLPLAAEIRSLTHVALQFPKWTDGRAYSQAALLRGRIGYRGQIIATGQVVVDMLPLLQRCGFDAAQLREGQSFGAARRVLALAPEPYQAVLAERSAASGNSPRTAS